MAVGYLSSCGHLLHPFVYQSADRLETWMVRATNPFEERRYSRYGDAAGLLQPLESDLAITLEAMKAGDRIDREEDLEIQREQVECAVEHADMGFDASE